MFKFFAPSGAFQQQDVAPFQFRHQLASHPNLTLAHLTEIIPTLPQADLYCSDHRMQLGESFDNALNDGNAKYGHAIGSIIESLPTSDAYVMVKMPERLPTLRDLFADLLGDVEETIRARGLGEKALDPRTYLFISSPHSVTPFHYDRYSNFLLQIRGSKEVTVFPPWDNNVITPEEYESYMARTGNTVTWKPQHAPRGRTFVCQPGDGLHIPFVAGHHVKNGPELSITLSIFFNNNKTRRQLDALLFNQRTRKKFAAIGLKPMPVGTHATLDAIKGYTFRSAQRATALARRFISPSQ